MAAPTFDGYPIFAQMARLQPSQCRWTTGYHDLDAMADAATDAQVVVVCRPHNPTGTVAPAEDLERFLQRIGSGTMVLLDEAYIEFVSPRIASTPSSCCDGSRTSLSCAPSQKRTGWRAYGPGTASARRPWVGHCGRCSCRSGPPSPAWPRSRRRSRPKLSCVAGSNGSPQNATICARGSGRWVSGALTPMPTSSICLTKGQLWPEAFDGTGPRVRIYSDGGARITVGNRQSTQAVLATIAAMSDAS